MKNSAYVPYLTVALLFAAPALFTGCKNAQATIQTKEAPAIHVETTATKLTEIPLRLRLTGDVRGQRETDLAANVAGRLLETKVERGQRVEVGDLLAKVDTRSAQLALHEAQVSVATSEAQEQINQSECERYDRLKAAGAVTDLEYEQVTAKCKTAPLNLKAAQARQMIAAKNVGDGMIRAPFSGVVTERYVEVGEYVQASSRVVSLAQVDALKVVFTVPEKHFPQIKLAAEVLVKVAAYEGQTFSGKVAHISGAVRDTRDLVVEAVLEQDDSRLLPGMFAEVQLTIGTQKLPTVPQSAVFEENGKINVFVAKDHILEQRVVAVEADGGDQVVVSRGLKEGDLIVTAPTKELKNGTRIK